MALIQHRRYVRFCGMVLIVPMLSACSGFGGGAGEGHHRITIDSEPPNATVYAGGNEIGETPLSINPGEIFETRFTSGSADSEGIVAYRYVGTLSIKKPGCKSYSTQVDDHILSKDIQVKLECDPDYRPAAVQPAMPTPAPAPAPAPAQTLSPAKTPAPAPAPATQDTARDLPAGSAEERLREIEDLYIKGLLSDEEYQTLRQRVLDTL